MMDFAGTAAGPGLNTLDLRIFTPTYNGTAQKNYLNRADVQSILHLNRSVLYESCSGIVYHVSVHTTSQHLADNIIST